MGSSFACNFRSALFSRFRRKARRKQQPRELRCLQLNAAIFNSRSLKVVHADAGKSSASHTGNAQSPAAVQDAAPQAPCIPMVASPSPEPGSHSPDSVTSSHVRCSDESKRGSAVLPSKELKHNSTRSSGKRASNRSQQGSIGPAGYSLTPMQKMGELVTENSADRPVTGSLTPGLHEVTPLHPQTSRISAPNSAFCAKAVIKKLADHLGGEFLCWSRHHLNLGPP